MNEEALDQRRASFRWHSKQELCDYFSIHYGFNKKLVEAEIAEAMKTFRIRKGQAIRMPELWQKVGLRLEKKIKEIDL
jgi:hypothetical protein